MKQVLMVMVLALGPTACATSNRRVEEQQLAEVKQQTKAYEFDGNCGMGLCRKKGRVPCDPRITLEYKNKNYCFSSTEARDTFIRDIDNNIEMAQEQWSSVGAGQK